MRRRHTIHWGSNTASVFGICVYLLHCILYSPAISVSSLLNGRRGVERYWLLIGILDLIDTIVSINCAKVSIPIKCYSVYFASLPCTTHRARRSPSIFLPCLLIGTVLQSFALPLISLFLWALWRFSGADLWCKFMNWLVNWHIEIKLYIAIHKKTAILHKTQDFTFSVCPSCSDYHPLDSEAGLSGDFWSKTEFLNK